MLQASGRVDAVSGRRVSEDAAAAATAVLDGAEDDRAEEVARVHWHRQLSGRQADHAANRPAAGRRPEWGHRGIAKERRAAESFRRTDRPVAAIWPDDERRGGPDATGPRRSPFELLGAERRVGHERNSWFVRLEHRRSW